jgi:hypothetical protein
MSLAANQVEPKMTDKNHHVLAVFARTVTRVEYPASLETVQSCMGNLMDVYGTHIDKDKRLKPLVANLPVLRRLLALLRYSAFGQISTLVEAMCDMRPGGLSVSLEPSPDRPPGPSR